MYTHRITCNAFQTKTSLLPQVAYLMLFFLLSNLSSLLQNSEFRSYSAILFFFLFYFYISLCSVCTFLLSHLWWTSIVFCNSRNTFFFSLTTFSRLYIFKLTHAHANLNHINSNNNKIKIMYIKKIFLILLFGSNRYFSRSIHFNRLSKTFARRRHNQNDQKLHI